MDHQRLIIRLGDFVRIKAGPYAQFTGKVEGINQSKSLLKVKLDIFGRATALKVNFSEVEKMSSPPPAPPWTTRH